MADTVAKRLWSVGPFELGGLAAVGGGAIVLFSLCYLFPLLGTEAMTYLSYYLLELALLPLVTLALFRASRRQRSSGMRSFFHRLGLAALAWSIVALLRWPLEQTFGPAVEDLVRDVLYAAYYVAFLWAIEWAPEQTVRPQGARRIALVGSLVLVLGSLLYIRVVPGLSLPVGEAPPDVLLYLLLDGYIAIRLALLARQARTAGVRIVYGLLTVAGLCFTIFDGLELVYALGLHSYSVTSLSNLVWLLPYPWWLLATHVRESETVDTEARQSAASPLSALSSLWSPLIAYGFALPAVHISLYASGFGLAAAERPRALFVLAWLVALGLLILLQRAAIAGRILAAERDLRASSEQIRRLTGMREAAVDAERRVLAKELADGPGRQLLALRGDLSWLAARQGRSAPGLRDRLDAAAKLAAEALESADRIASGLRPRTLDELGLAAALRELVTATKSGGRLDVRLMTDDDLPNLTPEQEIALYRIAQEGLTNCLKHSGARRIEVELSVVNGRAVLEIRDDGLGFPDDFESGSTSIGLLSMQERAHAAGGGLLLGTGIGGRGFSVRVSIDPRAAQSEARG